MFRKFLGATGLIMMVLTARWLASGCGGGLPADAAASVNGLSRGECFLEPAKTLTFC